METWIRVCLIIAAKGLVCVLQAFSVGMEKWAEEQEPQCIHTPLNDRSMAMLFSKHVATSLIRSFVYDTTLSYQSRRTRIIHDNLHERTLSDLRAEEDKLIFIFFSTIATLNRSLKQWAEHRTIFKNKTWCFYFRCLRNRLYKTMFFPRKDCWKKIFSVVLVCVAV